MIKLRALLSLLCRGTQVAIRGRFAKPLGWVSRCAGSNPALDAKDAACPGGEDAVLKTVARRGCRFESCVLRQLVRQGRARLGD